MYFVQERYPIPEELKLSLGIDRVSNYAARTLGIASEGGRERPMIQERGNTPQMLLVYCLYFPQPSTLGLLKVTMFQSVWPLVADALSKGELVTDSVSYLIYLTATYAPFSIRN